MAVDSDASGDFCFVEIGDVNGDNGFVCTSDNGSAKVGTHSLTFTQFSGAGQVIPGTNLSKSGNTINLDDSISLAGTLGVTGAATLSNNLDITVMFQLIVINLQLLPSPVIQQLQAHLV